MIFPLKSVVSLNNNSLIDTVVGDTFNIWMYTYDIQRKAIITVNAPIKILDINEICGYKIYLDNDAELLVSEHAHILMRDGEYKRISELVNNDSVMPFCLSSMGQPRGYPVIPHRSIMRKYEHIFQPWYNNWESVHRMVLREKLGRPIRNKFICHHIDENFLNNNPDNLMEMDAIEHNRLNKKYLISESFKEKRVEACKNSAKKRWSIREYRDKHSEFMKSENKKRNFNFEYRKKLSENVSIGRKNMRSIRNGLTSEEEVQLYKTALERYVVFKEAAKSLGMHPNTFRRRLRAYNLIEQKIPREDIGYMDNSAIFEKKSDELVNLMKQFITIKDAAKSLGIHPQTLSRKLDIYGVWNRLSSLNNHKVIKIENIVFSGRCAFIDIKSNIGLLQGVFLK